MLTENRWQKEQELMRSVFPEFIPFSENDGFGFAGCLKGHKSGIVYHVTIEAAHTTYPQCPPSVFMEPRIGTCWIGTEGHRKLCMDREWRPARSTFANTLLAVIRYLDEFDREPGPALQPDRADAGDRLAASDTDLRSEGGAGLPSAWYGSRSYRLW